MVYDPKLVAQETLRCKFGKLTHQKYRNVDLHTHVLGGQPTIPVNKLEMFVMTLL